MAVTSTLVATPAAAAAPAPRIVDAYVISDAGTSGVMNAGDTFALVFDRKIQVDGASFGVSFTDGTGASGYWGDQGPEIRWTVEDLAVTGRNGRVKVYDDRVIRAELLADWGEGYPIPSRSLPLFITDIGGVYPVKTYADVDLARSTDTVIDVE